jgi:hypothetical protein
MACLLWLMLVFFTTAFVLGPYNIMHMYSENDLPQNVHPSNVT